MNKKVFILLVLVISISLVIYKVILNVIDDAVDNANQRGIDLYVSAINYAYTAHYYKTGEKPKSIAELDINITTKVKCVEEKIDKNGKIELHGCTVENSKVKYGYINNKIVKE